MFIYEKDGKLNIMVASNMPAAAGEKADIVIEADGGKAKILVNGSDISVSSSAASDAESRKEQTQPTRSAHQHREAE